MSGKKSKKKATKIEIETRISEIIKFISEGKSNSFILEYIRQKYKVERAQIYVYIKAAYNRLLEINQTSIYAYYIKSLAFKQELLAKAMKDENYELALRISQNIDKLTGVEANALLISGNLDFSRLLVENSVKEFDIANESSSDKIERRNKFLLAMQNRIGEVFEQAFPFAFQTKQLKPGDDDKDDPEEEKIVDCVL